MKKEKFSWSHADGYLDCWYGGIVNIVVPTDDFWDWVVSMGHHVWSVDGFDPNSLYGHTSSCGTLSEGDYFDYLKCNPQELIDYINEKLNN